MAGFGSDHVRESNEKDVAQGCERVLHVVEELDDILAALRLLIRACEKLKLHDPVHALELSLEVALRRRNYILNVSSVSGIGPSYDIYPCENCYMTYPTAYLVSWLEYILKDEEAPIDIDIDDGNVSCCSNSNAPVCSVRSSKSSSSSLLCRRTCSLYFDTRPRDDQLADGVLYPMGAPYVSGPKGDPPPYSSIQQPGAVGELYEVDCLYRTLCFVRKRLGLAVSGDGSAIVRCSGGSDTALADSLKNLFYTRRHFGFDMDCVCSADVDTGRSRLSEVLYSYDSRVLVETFNACLPYASRRYTDDTSVIR